MRAETLGLRQEQEAPKVLVDLPGLAVLRETLVD